MGPKNVRAIQTQLRALAAALAPGSARQAPSHRQGLAGTCRKRIWMKLAFLVLCFGILVGPPVVAGEDAVPPRTHQGWGWLVEKLVADGLDRERVTHVFDDPRLGAFTGLEFSLAPREPHSL